MYPRAAPDDRQAPADVALEALRDRAPAVGRGRLPVPDRRAREQEGRTAVRHRRGARRHARARRRGHVAAGAPPRAHAARGGGGDARGPGTAPRRGSAALEPDLPARLAAPRHHPRRTAVADAAAQRAHRGPRAREGGAARRRWPTPSRASSGTRNSACPTRAATAWCCSSTSPAPGPSSRSTSTRRRWSACASAGSPTPTRWCACSRRRGEGTRVGHPARRVRRVRPRRTGRARPGRSSVRQEHGERRGRRDPQLHAEVPGGHDARDRARRSQQGGRVGGRAGVPADPRAASSSPRSSACPSSGSPCRRARRSRWRAAPRTWTGSAACCARSSSSRRPAARSTSSSRASPSAPSPTGTPRRRC